MTPKQKLVAKVGAGAAAIATALVIQFEGYVPYVYKDPIGRLAVCYGHDDQTMRVGEKFTKSQCDELLAEDLLKHSAALSCIDTPLTDGQKAAFISFAYNVGTGAFCGSTLARRANAGDMAGACSELDRWVYAKGKKLPGLVKRRQTERQVCES